MIYTEKLGRSLGCEVVAISALKGTGIQEATDRAVRAAGSKKQTTQHRFEDGVENAIHRVAGMLQGGGGGTEEILCH